MSKSWGKFSKLSGPGMKQPRFRGGSKRTGKRIPTNKSLNKKIKKIQSREELKHIDTIQSAVEISTTPVLTLLNGVATGDTDITRDGNDITCTSVQFRLRYVTDSGNLGTTPAMIRTVLLWDLQCNGAAPTAADIFDVSVITAYMNAPYNRTNQKRFKILYDNVVVLNPTVVGAFTVATGVTTAIVPIARYLNAKRALSRITKFDAATAAVTDIVSNSLYLFQVSSVAAGSEPFVLSGFRVYFKDD